MNQFARPGLAVTELPSFNENDKGKVLKIDSESGVLGWGEAGGSGLPSTETASAGDVLTLDNSKDPQWAAPSGGGGVLVVHDTDGTLDKTWQEIHDADFAVLYKDTNTGVRNVFVAATADSSDTPNGYLYAFYPIAWGFDEIIYAASTANGYPAVQS